MSSLEPRGADAKPEGILAWSTYVKRVLKEARDTIPVHPGTMIAWDACHNKDYHIDSFLCVDDVSLTQWAAKQAAILDLTQGRVIKYSKLNDKIRQRGLVPLLQAAYDLRGISVTIAIERTAIDAWVKDAGELIAPIIQKNFHHAWKHPSLWKATVVVDNVNLLLDSFYLNEGRKMVCFDNDDDIWGNENQKKDFENMMRHWRSHTGSANRDVVNLTFDRFDPLGTSLTAIPDLIAGAVSSILHGLQHPEQMDGPMSVATLPGKARIIGDWIWSVPRSLHTIVIVVGRHEKGIQTYKLGNPFYPPEPSGPPSSVTD